MSEELQIVQQGPVAVAQRQPTPLDILAGVVSSGNITTETASVAKSIMDMIEHQEDRAAEREFNAAFCQLQAEMPEVIACKIVPKGAGYKYAPTEDIMRAAKPLLTKYGFAVTLTTESPAPDKVTGVAILMHKGGHSRTAKIIGRLGAADDSMKGDIGTATRMQREALCDVLGIMRRPGNPEDATIIGNGKTITSEQAMNLEARADACGMSKAALLDFAGKVKTFDDIPAAKLEGVEWMIDRKERAHSK